jgi:HEAT repeat protein
MAHETQPVRPGEGTAAVPPMDVAGAMLEVVVSAEETGSHHALLRALGDGDWRVRRAAANAMPEVAAAEISAPLFSLLASEHAGERNAAVKAFIKLGAQVVETLVGGLGVPDADVRNFCALSLGRIGEGSAVPALMEALEVEPDPNVRYAIVEALGWLQDARAVPSLLAVLPEDACLAAAAASALGSIGCVEAVPALVEIAGDPVIGGVVISALADIGDPRALPVMVAQTARLPRHAALLCLASVARLLAGAAPGDVAVMSRIRRLLPHDDRLGLVRIVCEGLAEGGAARSDALAVADWLDAVAVLPALLAALEDASLHQRARDCLRRRVRTVVDLIEEDAVACGAYARRAVLEAVASAGGSDEAGFCLEQLDDPDPAVRALAVRAVAAVGDVAAMRCLTPLLHDGDEGVRSAAVEAVAADGLDTVVDAVLALAGDPDPAVRRTAAALLVGARSLAPLLCDVLLASTGDPDEVTRATAAGGLVASRFDAIPEALPALLEDPSAAVRAAAAGALATFGTADVRVLLQRCLTDGATLVRLAAVRGISAATRADAVELLLGAARDAAPRVALAAIEGLGGQGGEQAVAFVRSLLTAEEADTRVAALRALADADRRAAVDAARAAAEDEAWEVRAAAAGVLCGLGDSRVEAVVERLLRDEDATVRAAAAASLPGAVALDVVRLLLTAIDDHDVGFAAERELLRIAASRPEGVLSRLDPQACDRETIARFAAAVAGEHADVLLRALLASGGVRDRWYAVAGLSDGGRSAVEAVRSAEAAEGDELVRSLMAAMLAERERA